MAAHHTFGDSCLLKEEGNTFTRRASSVASDAPKITAQFFYCSALPIDDPLAAIPLPSSGSTAKFSRVPPRPFSVRDNIALDEAWLQPQDARQQTSLSSHQMHGRRRSISTSMSQNTKEKDSGREDLGPLDEHTIHQDPEGPDLSPGDGSTKQMIEGKTPVSTNEIIHDENESGISKVHKRASFFHRQERGGNYEEDTTSARVSNKTLFRGRQEEPESAPSIAKSPDTTGTPFLRAPSRTRRSRSKPRDQNNPSNQVDGVDASSGSHRPKQASPLGLPDPDENTEHLEDHNPNQINHHKDRHSFKSGQGSEEGNQSSSITVGAMRLHTVELPSLQVCAFLGSFARNLIRIWPC